MNSWSSSPAPASTTTPAISIDPGCGLRTTRGYPLPSLRDAYAKGVSARSPGCVRTPKAFQPVAPGAKLPGERSDRETIQPRRGCRAPILRTPPGCVSFSNAPFPGCVLRTTRGYPLPSLRDALLLPLLHRPLRLLLLLKQLLRRNQRLQFLLPRLHFPGIRRLIRSPRNNLIRRRDPHLAALRLRQP
jgi:hypothetical protein